MKKLLIVALVGLFTMTLSSWTTTNAGADHYSYNITVPYNGSFEDPCTGEMINWTGTLHYHGNVTITPNGGVHASHHGNTQSMSGVTDSGATYISPWAFNDTWNTTVGHEHTYIETFSVISQGSGDNFKLKIKHHHTTNANGDVSVWFTIISAECD